MNKVLVVGSLNMDFAVYAARRPAPGETVRGRSMRLVPGGKGANQAYALGRMGASVAMIGAVGTDSFGDMLVENLAQAGVNTAPIQRGAVETGKAFIEIDDSGENCITIIGGANDAVDVALLEANRELFTWADAVVMQLEIPLATVVHAAKMCRAAGARLVLDPAPGERLPDELLSLIDILKPNETELAILTGMSTGTEEEVIAAARSLNARGVKHVMVTLGGSGTLLVDAAAARMFPAYQVTVVDTTAAGDCFLAAFISQFDGEDFASAVDFGARAAAIAVTRPGAQASIPTYAEVMSFNGGERNV